MVTIHPNILEHDGKKAFVVLPYEEFLMIEEVLGDYEDLKELRLQRLRKAMRPRFRSATQRRNLDCRGSRVAELCQQFPVPGDMGCGN